MTQNANRTTNVSSAVRSCLLFWGSDLNVWTWIITLPVSTHLSSVVLLLCLVLLHHAGKAAGVGGRAGKVLSLGDGWRPATHRQTTHLGQSDRANTRVLHMQNFISKCSLFVFSYFPSKRRINLSSSFHSKVYSRQETLLSCFGVNANIPYNKLTVYHKISDIAAINEWVQVLSHISFSTCMFKTLKFKCSLLRRYQHCFLSFV